MKTVYRHENGKLISRKASDAKADELISRGWLAEKPEVQEEEPVKRRGRKPKKVEANDDEA